MWYGSVRFYTILFVHKSAGLSSSCAGLASKSTRIAFIISSVEVVMKVMVVARLRLCVTVHSQFSPLNRATTQFRHFKVSIVFNLRRPIFLHRRYLVLSCLRLRISRGGIRRIPLSHMAFDPLARGTPPCTFRVPVQYAPV
jgi:hypothetical protein